MVDGGRSGFHALPDSEERAYAAAQQKTKNTSICKVVQQTDEAASKHPTHLASEVYPPVGRAATADRSG